MRQADYRALSGDLCIDASLGTIYGRVFDPSNNQVAWAEWPCSAHQGTINNIPTGTGLTLVVEGCPPGSSVVTYKGQAQGLSIRPNETTVAPTVTLASVDTDTSIPSVTGRNPASGAINVPITTSITVNFNKNMAASTIDDNSFKLMLGGTKVSGTVSYDAATRTATLVPQGNLAYSVNYGVILTTAVKDLSLQRSLASEESWNFNTEGPPGSAPTAPVNIAMTGGSDQISLTWDAVSGAASYNVYWSTTSGVNKSSPNKNSVLTSSFNHTGLANSTTYYYVVTAVSSFGESPESNQASATTQSAADTSAPTIPTNVNASAASSTEINLSWDASTDNVGVTAYRIFRNGSFLKSVTGTSASDTGLAPSTQYCYTIKAADAANNESAQSAQQCATTSAAADTTAPTEPTNLAASAVSTSEISLSWSAATDNVGVTAYKIFRNGSFLKSVTGTSASDTGLAPSTQYCYTIKAADAANNESGQSSQACATTYAPSADTTPPSAPAGLNATAVSSSQLNLAWDQSSDNVGVTGYRIYRKDETDGETYASIGTFTGTAISDTGLKASHNYCYTVTAIDAANNESVQSGEQCATTQLAATPPPPS